MGSNWTDAAGRMMTSNTPPPSEIAKKLGVSTNDADAIWKAATKK